MESGQIVNNLAEKGLVEEAGRLDVPGRPIAYRTTLHFLRDVYKRQTEYSTKDKDDADTRLRIQLQFGFVAFKIAVNGNFFGLQTVSYTHLASAHELQDSRPAAEQPTSPA